ncbi:16S rRNA (cytidine(1402)-2'-O)-methyltransferase [Sulfuriroseicoccus oceanibius]|uniref:Ribosomal RNA small subunit methyltransferase I n=1 Tax=Sulfuriroseicoccus oceanibius TaxID=2707525 RepID=A0A6B3L2R8_9BACT|nr:16S rRNA (cytidine(1402)-2'-O)-methyltransferase [Sulfuriroseicoccus oceanibius]QQL44500.1 16S rRNA (cytidine(1402)-2'-O)-methyltransferase [Sulfuriroseicoccus oceanibius]
MSHQESSTTPRVVLVPTPIGNLGDITLRALDALKEASVIACEDTRRARILLKHFEIDKPTISLHEHNEASRSQEIIKRVQDGQVVAVVSDAGMPGISDPGLRLTNACADAGVPVEVLPGACAVPLALVGSGMPTEQFVFDGFLPPKSGRRQTMLTAALERESATSIFYESPHRLTKTLKALADLDPERWVCVARELTKKFETYHQGNASSLLEHFTKQPPKGEIVLLIAPQKLPKFLTDRSLSD